MKLTNSTLSKLCDIPLSKMRRWTKEFLPPDPRATRRSGYTRELTLNESFYVILGGGFVDEIGWTYHQARTVLGKIWPWMEKIGMVPEIPEWARREGVDAIIKIFHAIEFWKDRKSNALSLFKITGWDDDYRERTERKKDSLDRPYKRYTSIIYSYYLNSELEAISEDKAFEVQRRSKLLGRFQLDDLLHMYFDKIYGHLDRTFEGELYDKWYERFREIAKPS